VTDVHLHSGCSDGPALSGALCTDGPALSGVLCTDGPALSGVLRTDGPALSGVLCTDEPALSGALLSPSCDSAPLISCAPAEVHSSVSYIRVMQVIICMHDDSQASSPPSRSHTCDEAACAFHWPGVEGVAARLHE